MQSEDVQRKRWEEEFWRNFSSVSDYFGPAVAPLQKKFGVGTKELMFQVGIFLGQKAARALDGATVDEMLDVFVSTWNDHGLGRLQVVSREPLELLIADCSICGQLPGTGEMYECALHEGFFQGALSAKTGKEVRLRQQTNYEGAAGTWCRRLAADTGL